MFTIWSFVWDFLWLSCVTLCFSLWSSSQWIAEYVGKGRPKLEALGSNDSIPMSNWGFLHSSIIEMMRTMEYGEQPSTTSAPSNINQQVV
jgi:hypothetical protein